MWETAAWTPFQVKTTDNSKTLNLSYFEFTIQFLSEQPRDHRFICVTFILRISRQLSKLKYWARGDFIIFAMDNHEFVSYQEIIWLDLHKIINHNKIICYFFTLSQMTTVAKHGHVERCQWRPDETQLKPRHKSFFRFTDSLHSHEVKTWYHLTHTVHFTTH